jgi:hypothetical protein
MPIFGGIGRALTKPGENSGLSIADRLAIFGTAYNGDYDTAMAIRNAPAQRAQMAALQKANAEAAGLYQPIAGEMRQVPGQMRQMNIGNNAGEDITAAFGSQMEQSPPTMEQGPSRQRSPQEIAAALADLQGRVPGFNAKPFVDIAAYAKPNLQLMNDQLVDPTTGQIKRSLPRVGENQQLVFDSNNNPIGVMDLNGAIQSLANREEAQTTGRTMGTVFNRQDPLTGSTTPTLGRDMFAPGGIGPGRTQSRPDAIRAEAAATGDAERQQARLERAASAPRQLSALDEMERLLPDVISGFGSDMRINTARAMALAGNEEAARKVAATETFINQGRILVAGIIKTFGSNPTEGERKFAEKMSGADAELNPETLKEGIRLQRERIFRELEDAGKPSASTRAPVAPSRAALEAEARRRGLM